MCVDWGFDRGHSRDSVLKVVFLDLLRNVQSYGECCEDRQVHIQLPLTGYVDLI